MFDFYLKSDPQPVVYRPPKVVSGYQLRIDLNETKPPVWRRVVVPSSITLPELHEVIQGAMGWFDCHLHQFAVGTGWDAPRFLTDYDISEGAEGLGEEGIRLDQVLRQVGDKLTYTYDFGDNWRHKIKLEKILKEVPAQPTVIAGKRACPPEDVGGVWGYHEAARWVETGYPPDGLPDGFTDIEHGLSWLNDWHPDDFSVEMANESVGQTSQERWFSTELPDSVPSSLITPQLGELAKGSQIGEELALKIVSEGDAPLPSADAIAAALQAHLWFLEKAAADELLLTAAGYLKPPLPKMVAPLVRGMEGWIGTSDREHMLGPVLAFRESLQKPARLLRKYKGRLLPTRAAKTLGNDPVALFSYLAAALGDAAIASKDTFSRDANLLGLALIATSDAGQVDYGKAAAALAGLRWQHIDGTPLSGHAIYRAEPSVLHFLEDVATPPFNRHSREEGFDPVAVALARAALLSSSR